MIFLHLVIRVNSLYCSHKTLERKIVQCNNFSPCHSVLDATLCEALFPSVSPSQAVLRQCHFYIYEVCKHHHGRPICPVGNKLLHSSLHVSVHVVWEWIVTCRYFFPENLKKWRHKFISSKFPYFVFIKIDYEARLSQSFPHFFL